MTVKSVIVSAMGVWVFLCPLLCMAGIACHNCGDCDVSLCSHEEECADDPCPDLFVASRCHRDNPVDSDTLSFLPQLCFDPDSFTQECVTATPTSCSTTGLQVHESDLPLLN